MGSHEHEEQKFFARYIRVTTIPADYSLQSFSGDFRWNNLI